MKTISFAKQVRQIQQELAYTFKFYFTLIAQYFELSSISMKIKNYFHRRFNVVELLIGIIIIYGNVIYSGGILTVIVFNFNIKKNYFASMGRMLKEKSNL